MRTVMRTGLLSSLTLLLLSCSLFVNTNQPLEIIVIGNSIVLEWDPPAGAGTSSLKRVDAYELFYQPYRSGQASAWQLLSAVPAGGTLRYLVTTDELNPGTYAFAVRAVYTDDSTSDYHASTDNSADPPAGWYLTWIGE